MSLHRDPRRGLTGDDTPDFGVRTAPDFFGHAFLDWDDTIAGAIHLFEAAERENAHAIAAALGLDPDAVLRKATELDVEIARRDGLGKDTFPTAHVTCYQFFCSLRGVAPDPALRAALWRRAEAVYHEPQELLDGAEHVVRWLREAGFEVNVWTGGDSEVQRAKIERSGLRPLFHNVFTTVRKDADALAHALGPRPRGRSFVAGNSLHSDVVPALKLGMLAVHVEGRIWGFDHAEIDPSHPHFARVASLRDLPALVMRRLDACRPGA